MKATKIETNKVYEIAVGKNKTTVKVVNVNRRVNGQLTFECLNIKTNKPMVVADSQRFLKEIKTKTVKAERVKSVKPDGLLSAVNAAYKVLTDAGRPMRVKEIAEIALRDGLCGLQGLTPEFTISAVIQRDIKVKGDASRFVKAERGLFAAR